MAKKTVQEDYAKTLADEYARWQYLYEYGGRDPHWADGSSINNTRNHITYAKRKIEESMKQEDYPDDYYRELPPEVPRDYMARADEIREHACEALRRYLADPDYQFLCKRIDGLNRKDAKRLCVANVIAYAEKLHIAIESDDLLYMRCHERADNYIESFASCAQRVRELKPRENEQLSLYNLDFDDDEDEDDWEM